MQILGKPFVERKQKVTYDEAGRVTVHTVDSKPRPLREQIARQPEVKRPVRVIKNRSGRVIVK